MFNHFSHLFNSMLFPRFCSIFQLLFAPTPVRILVMNISPFMRRHMTQILKHMLSFRGERDLGACDCEIIWQKRKWGDEMDCYWMYSYALHLYEQYCWGKNTLVLIDLLYWSQFSWSELSTVDLSWLLAPTLCTYVTWHVTHCFAVTVLYHCWW